MTKIYSLLSFLFFISCFAQDLKGKWVEQLLNGSLGYAEILITENSNNSIEGISYDTSKSMGIISGGKCSHYFSGTFTELNKNLALKDYSTIFKTFNHFPSVYNLYYRKVGEDEFLEGTITVTSIDLSDNIRQYPTAVKYKKIPTDSVSFSVAVKNLEALQQKHDPEDELHAQHTSADLSKAESEIIQPKKAEIQTPIIDSIPKPIATNTKKPQPNIVSKYYVQNEISAQEKESIITYFKKRNTKILANIISNDDFVELKIADYGQEDGDLISIILNKKVVYHKLEIKNKEKIIRLPLNASLSKNELIFIADNLGKIAPNTASITVVLNGKNYKYSLLTDLNTNAKVSIQR